MVMGIVNTDNVKRVYVFQFNAWYSFTRENWIQMIKDMNETETGISFLNYGKEIKSTPYKYVNKADDYYWPKDNTTLVYKMICDWDEEQYENVLKSWNLEIKSGENENNEPNLMNQIKLESIPTEGTIIKLNDNIEYKVVQYDSTKKIKTFHPTTANEMENNGIIGRLILQKPKDKNFYISNIYRNMTTSKPYRL